MHFINTSYRRDYATADDLADCRALIRNGSKSFYAASHLLPAALRQDAFALYAFCRVSDDMVDIEGGAELAIARLRTRLKQVYEGCPEDSPVDRAFADVVARHALPRALPEALIDGLAWDVRGVKCENLSDVYAYGARVAGSVGAMMAVLMGVRAPDLLARACDLGVAMQLTNIARDVGEDARSGRLYLPRAWLRECGLDPDSWLKSPVFNPTISRTVARLLSAADELYRRADEGIARLPIACRPGIFAARYIYHAIGGELTLRGFDSIASRARVGTGNKCALIGAALLAAVATVVRRRSDTGVAALPETAYLVHAVSSANAPVAEKLGLVDHITGRILWVAELFADLETRKRTQTGKA